MATVSINKLPFNITATLTRPADTTAYAAGDAVTDSTSAPTDLEFIGSGGSGGGTLSITNATLSKSGPNLDVFHLYLFTAAVTATNDNAAFALTDANNDTCIGVINFGTGTAAANNSFYNTGVIDVRVPLDSGSQTIYGLLRATAGFTPLSAETFKITLKGDVLLS